MKYIFVLLLLWASFAYAHEPSEFTHRHDTHPTSGGHDSDDVYLTGDHPTPVARKVSHSHRVDDPDFRSGDHSSVTVLLKTESHRHDYDPPHTGSIQHRHIMERDGVDEMPTHVTGNGLTYDDDHASVEKYKIYVGHSHGGTYKLYPTHTHTIIDHTHATEGDPHIYPHPDCYGSGVTHTHELDFAKQAHGIDHTDVLIIDFLTIPHTHPACKPIRRPPNRQPPGSLFPSPIKPEGDLDDGALPSGDDNNQPRDDDRLPPIVDIPTGNEDLIEETEDGEMLFPSTGTAFYGWRVGNEKAIVSELEFTKIEAFPYFQAKRLEILFDDSVDLSALRIRLVSYIVQDDDKMINLSDITKTDNRLTYTDTIPVFSTQYKKSSGLGFEYKLYNRHTARHLDIAVTKVDGFLPHFDHFILTRQIDSELWSADIPNNWILTEVEQAPEAPSIKRKLTTTWAKLKLK